VYLLLAAYLAFAVPKLPAVSAALVTAALVVALLVADRAAHRQRPVAAADHAGALLVFGHLFMTVKKFRITES